MGDYSPFDVFVMLVQLISPFAILWLTIKSNRKDKQHDIERKKEQDAADAKDKQFKEAIEQSQSAVEKAMTEINNLSASIHVNEELNNELRRTIRHIMKMNRLNGQYTHELAQLVIVLAEGVRDQHLDGNITRAITKYRHFESTALGDYITGVDHGNDNDNDIV